MESARLTNLLGLSATYVHHGPSVDDPGDVGWRVTAGGDTGHVYCISTPGLFCTRHRHPLRTD